MKIVQFALAAFSLAAASTSFASEAARFELPTNSSVTRAEVQAEARRASNAGELRTDAAYPRYSAPPSSVISRAAVRADALLALDNRSYGDKFTDPSFIGGL